MASNDKLLQRLILDHSQYDSGLKQSSKELDKFKSSNLSLDGVIKQGVTTLAKYASVTAAVSGAVKVATDAFKRSEERMDAWESACKQGESAYNTFLDTLTSGNWSNFFTNLDGAIDRASKLYDALDRLGSIKSNNAAAIAIEQKAIQDLRLLKQAGKTTTETGKNIDDEIKSHVKALQTLQMQSVNQGKKAGRMTVANDIMDRYNAAGGNNLAQSSANTVANELITKGQGAFDKYKTLYDNLRAKAQDTRTTSVGGGNYGGGGTQVTEQFTNLQKLTEEERKQYYLAKAITEGETTIQEGISIYAQAVSEGAAASKEAFKGNKYGTSGGGGKGGNTQIKLDDAQIQNLGIADKLDTAIAEIEVQPIVIPVDIEYERDFQKLIEADLAKRIYEIKTTTEGMSDAFNAAGASLSQFGSDSKEAAAAAKAFTLAGAIATLIGQFAAIPKGAEIWSWIAGTVAGTGTLIATIASLKSAGSYAEGGTIGGNSYYGDKLIAHVNSGESILTANQTRAAVNMIESNNNGGGSVRLRGEDLYIGMSNYLRRSGRGEIVTSR